MLIVSFDGFRYDYLDPMLTPNMYKVLRNEATTGHMLSTFSTKTFPNHHSISTGLYQQSHGIVLNEMFDPILNERFNDLSDEWWSNDLTRPIYVVNQMYDPRRASACSPWPGCHARYVDKSQQAKHFRMFNESSQWEEQLDWLLAKMEHPDEPINLALLYIYQPDRAAHLHGPFGSQTLEQVRRVDQFFEHLQRRLDETGLRDEINQIILSDHGSCEIHPSRATILETLLNTSWYQAYGGDPVYHVRPHPQYSGIVGQVLRDHARKNGHFNVYHKSELPERYAYGGHHRVHDFVVVGREGWSLHDTLDQWQRNLDKRGQHGYDNQAASMRPLFMALGPGLRGTAYRHPSRFTNVDLYPLMLHLLNIEHNFVHHEGNFHLVRGMLAQDTNNPD